MDNQEKRKSTDIFPAGTPRKAGQDTNLTEEMQKFINYNVGDLNTGWEPTVDDQGKDKYIYVNIENVKSDTLDIYAINDKNHIKVEIPNIYGTSLYLNSETNELMLLGRNEQGEPTILSTIPLAEDFPTKEEVEAKFEEVHEQVDITEEEYEDICERVFDGNTNIGV